MLYIVVWKEFLFGAAAGGFGEGMMHPIDTIKTRMQSQAILSEAKVRVLFHKQCCPPNIHTASFV